MARNVHNDNFAVALTKIQCPYCGDKRSGDLVMNTILSKPMAEKVDAIDGQVTSLETCSTCQAALDNGAVFLIEIDPEKTGVDANHTSEEPQLVDPSKAYLTGRVWGITEDAFKRMILVDIPRDRAVYIDPKVAEKLGLVALVKDDNYDDILI